MWQCLLAVLTCYLSVKDDIFLGSFFWKQVFNALKYVLGLIILVSVFDAAFQMRGSK